jgi:L-seryl-tRNA(Ser) seleniumtransferase
MSEKRDRFGNTVDPTVGYARGSILAGPTEENRRDRWGLEQIRRRITLRGSGSVSIFTGSPFDFPLHREDMGERIRESVGPALFWPDLRSSALEHLGAPSGDDVAVFNRTSAGIISSLTALAAAGEDVVSVVPGAISHPSVGRGARLAGAELVEVATPAQLEAALVGTLGRVAVVTPVTSELVVMPEDDLRHSIRVLSTAGRIVLADDAYGARVRPVLFGQRSARELGAHLAITSIHKAGLDGPRAGLLAGEPRLVQAAYTQGTELGVEARGPMALGVLRALERYGPERLEAEVAVGRELRRELASRLGEERVAQTAIGPLVEAEDVLEIVLDRAGLAGSAPPIVPAEATAALGMLLLEHHGILTVNAHGMPGARVSIRLKPTPEEVERAGGITAAAAAVDDALSRLAKIVDQKKVVRSLILGADPQEHHGSKEET